MAAVRALEDYNYHVFLSFRDEGSSRKFVDDLYKGLVGEGFRIFRHEDEIERVELEKSIKQSMISIIVLSEGYLSSRLCIDELAMILECRKSFGHRFFAIFFDIDTLQFGKQSVSTTETIDWLGEEFKVETDDETEKKDQLLNMLKEWREGLEKASNLKGLDLQRYYIADESKFVKRTIEVIENKRDTSEEDIVAVATEDWGLEEKPRIEWNDTNIGLRNCGVVKLPKKPFCPSLEELSLQQNPNLAEIPLTFFESMPTLRVLDLSNTSIKSLPPSISRLVQLREFFMKGCELMMELPPEIGLVGNLKVLDLEGTKLICLPKEIGMLHELTCLKVSLHKRADRYKQSRGIEAIVPRGILSKLSRLKELSIDVYPDCGWWDAELESIIINEQSSFRNLHTLKLYLPTIKLLEQLWQLPGVRRISNNRLTVGRHEKLIISPLPSNLQDKFEELPGCLKYVNGEGSHDAIAKALRYARALLLYRHWTIERLSEFKIDQMPELSNCLLVQCNEMKTIVDGGDFYQEGDGRKNYRRPPILGYLEHLSIHCMKNLESIWKGPIVSRCLYHLQTLALHTCPKLITLFNLGLLGNLRSLKLLIVEDCPEMKSLVNLESSFSESDDYFLPSLKKISLLHLPELVSISSGLRIAPDLESLIIYNCPKLKSLSPMELSSKDMEKIKGQSSWWEALDWHNSEWSSDQRDDMVHVFRPLGRDSVLMKQLAKAVGTSLHGQHRDDDDDDDLQIESASYVNEPFDKALSVAEMWRKLTAEPMTRAYMLQPDFIIMMQDYQQNPRNIQWQDYRFMQAYDVLIRKILPENTDVLNEQQQMYMVMEKKPGPELERF